MIRERFKIGAMLAAIGAMFRTRELQQLATPETPAHDEFHHHRNKRSGAGRPGVRKYRKRRKVRNEMAFQSRKHNR